MIRYSPFRIITLVVFIAFIVPIGIQEGMFMDGLIYASVSKNLANGFGSFWFPKFSQTFLANYHEQLPLFFGIQSLFFKILGNSHYVERVFSFLMACLTGFFIVKIWHLISAGKIQSLNMEWLPVLIWITIPACFWAYINNVQETLMGVFATASVFWMLKGLHENRLAVWYIFLAGVGIFCCSFCKGFQGLFPLVGISFYWLFLRTIEFKKALLLSLLLFSVPIFLYSIILINDDGFQSVSAFLNNRLVRTFTQQWSATTTNRFYIIGRLFTELLPGMGLVLLSFMVFKIKSPSYEITHQFRLAAFFIALALSGSVPLMVTLEQRVFYLVTPFPFFAIGLALLAEPFLTPLMERIKTDTRGFVFLKYASYSLLLAVIVISWLQVGKTKRDREMLQDVYAIGSVIPRGTIIGIPENMREEWSLIAYFVRYYDISLDPYRNNYDYFLTEKGSPESVPERYSKTELDLLKYELLRKELKIRE